MARYTGPKCKIFRREGLNIFEPNTSKHKTMTKKGYPPGMHGQSVLRKQTEYGRQLREKQKAKRIFGILEKQFKKYYQLANKSNDITGEALLKICEKRLDNVIYRAGFARTRAQARQMAGHGIFMVNGKRVTIPSILIKKGDKIMATNRAKSHKYFIESDKKHDVSPRWIKVDLTNIAAEITEEPDKKDLELSINSDLIIAYYSK